MFDVCRMPSIDMLKQWLLAMASQNQSFTYNTVFFIEIVIVFSCLSYATMFLFVHFLTAKVYTHRKAVDKLQQFVEQCFQVCLEAGVNKPTGGQHFIILLFSLL